jgi:hypothetical protein
MSLTKTLVGELLNSLRDNGGEEKIAAIIARLEALEENAKKTIIEEDVLQRAEKYNSINYNINLNNIRYTVKPLKVLVGPNTYKKILVPVQQYACCMAAEQDESNCCNNPCASCPYATGSIPKTRKDADATMVVDPAPLPEPVPEPDVEQESEVIAIDLQRSIAESEKNLVIGSSAPINLKKKPCDGCDCGRANNITIDIEDIGK